MADQLNRLGSWEPVLDPEPLPITEPPPPEPIPVEPRQEDLFSGAHP